MNFICSKASVVASIVAVTLLCGCDTVPTHSQQQNSTREFFLAQAHSANQGNVMADLWDQGEWNAVLNLDRLGKVALFEGDLDTAGRAFDGAIARIETVYADNPSARKARSTFSSEGTKDFKGEPHERAMTFLYRGLIDLSLGDFENARASFKAAEFQNTMSQQQNFDSTLPLATWLAGWASHCAGDEDKAREFYETADRAMKTYQPDASMPPARAQSRTLVVYEAGTGPGKIGEGKYKEQLAFQPGVETDHVCTDVFSDKTGDGCLDFNNASEEEKRNYLAAIGNHGHGEASVSYLALTRGGRQIDSILEGKAQFKTKANSAAETGADVAQGSLMAANQMSSLANQALSSGNTQMASADANAAMIGLGVAAVAGLFSMFSHAASNHAKPAADTRYWESLPNRLYVEDKLVSLDEPVKVVYHRYDVPSAEEFTPQLDRQANGCRLVAVSDGMSFGQQAHLHGEMAAKEINRVIARNHRRDAAFHNWLITTFGTGGSGSVTADKGA
jgi:hypothetical protein